MGQLILGVFKLRDINCQGENVSYIVFCQPKFVSFSAHYDVDILQKIDNKEFYRVSTMGYVLHESTNWNSNLSPQMTLINVGQCYSTNTLYQMLRQISFSASCTSCKCK